MKSSSLVFLFSTPLLCTTVTVAQATVPISPKILVCDESSVCTHQYIDGQKFKIITTDDTVMIVAISHSEHYMRVDISVSNNAKDAVDLLPAQMALDVVLPKPKVLALVSPEQIAKSADHRARWANVLNAMAAGMATQQTTTQTNSSGTVNTSGTVNATSSNGTYTNGSYSGTGTYSGTSTSTTSTPDYAAQARANERIQERNAAVASLRANLTQTSLKANSVMPNHSVRGYVYFQHDKHAQLVRLTIPLGGILYEFPFNKE
jgi:hypothetical protein